MFLFNLNWIKWLWNPHLAYTCNRGMFNLKSCQWDGWQLSGSVCMVSKRSWIEQQFFYLLHTFLGTIHFVSDSASDCWHLPSRGSTCPCAYPGPSRTAYSWNYGLWNKAHCSVRWWTTGGTHVQTLSTDRRRTSGIYSGETQRGTGSTQIYFDGKLLKCKSYWNAKVTEMQKLLKSNIFVIQWSSANKSTLWTVQMWA